MEGRELELAGVFGEVVGQRMVYSSLTAPRAPVAVS